MSSISVSPTFSAIKMEESSSGQGIRVSSTFSQPWNSPTSSSHMCIVYRVPTFQVCVCKSCSPFKAIHCSNTGALYKKKLQSADFVFTIWWYCNIYSLSCNRIDYIYWWYIKSTTHLSLSYVPPIISHPNRKNNGISPLLPVSHGIFKGTHMGKCFMIHEPGILWNVRFLLLVTSTPPKTKMTMDKHPFEDVSPIRKW